MEKEVSEVDRKLILKSKYLDKINYYLTRNPVSQDELYVFVRKFFAEYLKLDYEFTYEELSQELNKVFIKPQVKDTIDNFLIRLSESEYLEEVVLGTNELNNFLKELEDIINLMIYDNVPLKKEDSFIKKMFGTGTGEVADVILSSINYSIEDINRSITNGDVVSAKKSYSNLLEKYDSLNKEEKKRLHTDMTELYNRLQIAIKNPHAVVSENNLKSISPNTFVQKSNASTLSTATDNLANVDKISSDTSYSVFAKKVLKLIDETLFYIDASNMSAAKKSYVETLKSYDLLTSQEKSILHSKVNDLYSKLQSGSSLTSKISKSLLDKKSETKLEDNSTSKSEANITDTKNMLNNEQNKNKIDNLNKNEDKILLELPDLVPVSDSRSTGNSLIIDNGFHNNDDSRSISLPNINSEISKTVSENNNLSNTFTNVNPLLLERDTSKISPSSKSENVLFVLPESQTIKNEDKNMKVVDSNIAVSSKSKNIMKDNFDNVLYEKKVPIALSKEVILAKSVDTLSEINTTKDKNVLVNSSAVFSNVPSSSSLINESRDVSNVKTSISEIKTFSDNLIKNTTNTNLNSSVNSPIVLSMNEKIILLFRKIEDNMILGELENAKKSYADALVIYNNMRNEEKILCYHKFHDLFRKLDVALHKNNLTKLLDSHSSLSKYNGELVSTNLSDVSKPLSKRKIEESEKILTTSLNNAVNDSLIDLAIDSAANNITPVSNNCFNGIVSKNSSNIIADSNSINALKSAPISSNKPKMFFKNDLDIAQNSSKNLLELTYNQDVKTLPIIVTNDIVIVRIYELIEESYFNIENNNFDVAMLKYFKALAFYKQLSFSEKEKVYHDLYFLFKKMSSIKK